MDSIALTVSNLEADIKDHLVALEGLSRLQDVASWDDRAAALAEDAQRCEMYLSEAEERTKQLYEAAFAEHQQLPFYIRWLTSSKRAAKALQDLSELARCKERLRGLTEDLLSSVDKTPDSEAERKAMLKDLRLLKRELVLKKKEINAASRAARERASSELSQVGTGLGFYLSTPSSRRYDRMSIRLEKEASLHEHREDRDRIEAQIAVIDQHILWLERL